MSQQQEEFKQLARDTLKKAERETGPYRDVLLGVAEAYAALALHQGVLDDWSRTYPIRPAAAAAAPRSNETRSEPRAPTPTQPRSPPRA